MYCTEEYFFCYSNRLNQFLGIFGEYYIDKKINLNSGKEYKIYKKNDRLQKILKEWNRLKDEIDLNRG